VVDKILRVPITNIYGDGDYTAQISIGSSAVKANAILDTGSSTLAVVPKAYNVATDTDHERTSLTQDVLYGTGAGPAGAEDDGGDGNWAQSASVTSYTAVTEADERRGFGDADGIMGLA
jgi:hypothetical protein